MREYVTAATGSASPGKSFRELKAAHGVGTYEREAEPHAEPSTKRKMGNPLENEPHKVSVNVSAALSGLEKFSRSIRKYCEALRTLDESARRDAAGASRENIRHAPRGPFGKVG